jgi:Tol biopolymer transport system component
MRARPVTRFLLPTFIALTLGFLVLPSRSSGQIRAEDLFQQALRMERVSGDLEEAIRLYQRVVETGDRPLGARALIRIAESFEKLGRQGAQDAYARIIREYGDQPEEVALARERLAALERPAEAQSVEGGGIATRRLHKWVFGEAFPLAVTPDGSDLVFLDNWFGNLAVRDLSSGQSRDLTQDSSWSAWGAAVSPDGRTVSYLMAEAATSSLHLVGIDGADSRVLYRELGCPVAQHQWTADGEHVIAVVRCGTEAPKLMRVSVGSGDAELLAGLDAAEGISLSPDDRFLIYGTAVEGDGGNFDIWMLALDGSLKVPLVRHPANDQLLGWVPGSDEVLFLSDRDGTTDTWSIRVTESGPSGPPKMVLRSSGQIEPLGFAKGGALFYSSYKRWFSTGVAPFDLAGGRVAVESGTEILGSNMQPVWSPGGERLAMVPELEGPRGSGGTYNRPLLVYDLGTGSKRELASPLQTRNPQWSPDGGSILFSGLDATKGSRYGGGLYLVDVESGQTTQLLELDPETRTAFWSDLSAVWSPDGTAIIYALYDNNLKQGRLVWRDLASGEERELFRDPTLTSRQFDLSPDGRRLVFAVRSTATGYNDGIHSGGRLLIMDLDDGEVDELHQIPEQGRVYSLQWSPDGNHVLYTKREDSRTSVWRVPLSGGPAEKTWTFEEDLFDAYISLSPDGRRVAYTTYHQENEVWVMENLFSGGGLGGG